jgi:hypothetical protein
MLLSMRKESRKTLIDVYMILSSCLCKRKRLDNAVELRIIVLMKKYIDHKLILVRKTSYLYILFVLIKNSFYAIMSVCVSRVPVLASEHVDDFHRSWYTHHVIRC